MQCTSRHQPMEWWVNQPHRPEGESTYRKWLLGFVTTIIAAGFLLIAMGVQLQTGVISYWVLIALALIIIILAELRYQRFKLFYLAMGWKRIAMTLVLLVTLPALAYLCYLMLERISQ